jgi:protein-tyrosine kinase
MSAIPAREHLHSVGSRGGPVTMLRAQQSASIERLPKPHPRLVMANDRDDPRCEAVRALRTELLLRRGSNDGGDVVAMLSPCAGEGRSLLTADLAIAIAQSGRPTLLVDADLRNPQQHRLFRTHNKYGLSQAIQGGHRPQLRTVRKVPHLSLLTAGEIPGDPLELLSSLSFKLMIDDWRDHFRFVLIDTAPVSEFTDGLVIASLARRVLVLSRAQHTPDRQLREMLHRLAATRSEILGGVISHF